MAAARSGAARRSAGWGLAGLLVAGVAGCLDLGGVMDAAFPTAVPGLRADQPWISLPIRSWLVEGGIEAQAVSACTAAGCGAETTVAVFTARGRDAKDLARILDDPTRFGRELSERLIAGRSRATGRIARSRGTTEVAPRREGALSGFSIRIARADGSHPAFGYVLAARRPDAIAFVLVVSTGEDAARRIALDVAPHLG